MNIRPLYFNLANLFFLVLIMLLIATILATMQLKIRRAKKIGKWKLMADLLIRKAIFFEDDPVDGLADIPVTTRIQILLKKRQFRELLTQELIDAKKSVMGQSALSLTRLYRQLNLHEYALDSLKNKNWPIKAKMIQELSIMEIREHLIKIYRFTNHSNDLLRMEAQIAIIRFSGFEGLRFLDVISYPISEWQQINLLHELTKISHETLNGMEKWLRSDNVTVVIFALKLARIYHSFELHENICACLANDDVKVKLQAIYTLGEIFTDQTSSILIEKYPHDNMRVQMAILKALQNMATSTDIPFLLQQLSSESVELKVSAARALATIGGPGIQSMKESVQQEASPLTEIIEQIEGEIR
jgi:hypothetical protein